MNRQPEVCLFAFQIIGIGYQTNVGHPDIQKLEIPSWTI